MQKGTKRQQNLTSENASSRPFLGPLNGFPAAQFLRSVSLPPFARTVNAKR